MMGGNFCYLSGAGRVIHSKIMGCGATNTINLPYLDIISFCLGICMRQRDKYDRDALHFAPFVLFPSPFPREEFYKAVQLQTVLNELMHKVSWPLVIYLCANGAEIFPKSVLIHNQRKKLYIKGTVSRDGFYNPKSVFLAVNASLRWLNNVSGVYLVQVSMLLIGQRGLGHFFRYRPLLPIGWRIVQIKRTIQRQPLLLQYKQQANPLLSVHNYTPLGILALHLKQNLFLVGISLRKAR